VKVLIVMGITALFLVCVWSKKISKLKAAFFTPITNYPMCRDLRKYRHVEDLYNRIVCSFVIGFFLPMTDCKWLVKKKQHSC